MVLVLALLAALHLSGPTPFNGCGIDPQGGCVGGRAAVATGDQGGGVNPDGRLRGATPTSEQGGVTDPDGKPAR